MSKSEYTVKRIHHSEVSRLVRDKTNTQADVVELFLKCKIGITQNDYDKIRSYYEDKRHQKIVFIKRLDAIKFFLIDLKTYHAYQKIFYLNDDIYTTIRPLLIHLIIGRELNIDDTLIPHLSEPIDNTTTG